MKVDIRTAQLPELVAAARAGEEVVIEENGTEVARLVVAAPAERPRFRLGSLAHLAGTAPDFPPIPDEEIDRWMREKEERIAAALAGRSD